MQAFTTPTTSPQPGAAAVPASFAEAMEMRRAWLGEAEYQRQQALLRAPRGGMPKAMPERRATDRRAGDRRGSDRRARAQAAS